MMKIALIDVMDGKPAIAVAVASGSDDCRLREYLRYLARVQSDLDSIADWIISTKTTLDYVVALDALGDQP